MTVLCGGGTSGPKSTSPAAAYLVGNSLENIVQEVLGLSEAWASILVFAAAQSIQSSTFCATDPPTLVWPSASDIQYITTHYWDLTASPFQNLYSVIANGIWWTLCQCNTTATPSPPTPPAFPTGAPEVNPPGYGNNFGQPCLDQKGSTTVNESGGTVQLYPSGVSTVPIQSGSTVLKLSLFPTCVSGPCTSAFGTQVRYVDSTGTPHVVFGTSGAFGVTNTATVTIPTGATQWDFEQATGSDGSHIKYDWEVIAYCNGTTPTTPNGPCCPPDPSLIGSIEQLRQLMELVLQSLPTPINSYSEGTVHSTLSGNGTITLSGSPIAIKVDITTDSSHLGQSTADPTFLFDRGYIVPIINEGPIRGETRLTFNPQVYLLPLLTEQIGYSLHPGIVASITELNAGP